MFKKSLLALGIATAAVVGANSASAQTAFFADRQTQEAGNFVDLGNFNSPSAGAVEIYDFSLGSMGDLLGTQATTEGANSDVRVQLDHVPTGNVIAVLTVDGTVVGMEMIRIGEAG